MTDVTRLIAPVDTTITARGDSDDTFSVHLATSSPTAACLDEEIVALRARGYSLREIKKQLDEDRKAKVKR